MPAATLSAAPILRSSGDASRTYTATISTARVDRMGDSISVTGWKLANYKANPVVLFNHAQDPLPIGRATKVWSDAGRLRATFEFSDDADAQRVRKLVDDGFLFSTSVGFDPIAWKFSSAKGREMGIDFMEQELLEFSVVGVPANPDAVIKSASGTNISQHHQNANASSILDGARLSLLNWEVVK